MAYMTNKNLRGFTIVEVTIVVIVIAILATITTAAITNNLARARETARESDVATIMNALEKYYDANGEYPFGVSFNTDASPSKSVDYAAVKAALPSLTDADLTDENGYYFWAHPGSGSGFSSGITHHNQMPKQYMYFSITPGVTVNTYPYPYSAGRPYFWGCTVTINNSVSGGFVLAWRNETTGIWTFKKGSRGNASIADNGTTRADGQTCTFS